MKRIMKRVGRLFNVKNVKKMRELLSERILVEILNKILYGDESLKTIEIEDFVVTNVYFCGATLCLDIKNKKLPLEDTITICSNNTFGLFSGENFYKRSLLTKKEIELFNEISNKFLKNTVSINF